MATTNSSLAPVKVSVSDKRKVVAASFVGNFVEWFDYASYGYLATMIAAAFFPTRNPTAGLLATFGVFAISFVVRPFGGMVWGRIGDRMGRKTALALSILVMSGSTTAIAFLPTYRQVGLAAPLLLLVVRMVQGFSASGEYAGASTFLAEYAPVRRRGLQVSVVPASTAAGLLFGSLLATLLTGALSKPELTSVGWRLPFLLALPLGVIGWYIRNRLEDTPVFRSLEPAEHAAAPVKETLVRNRKAIGLAFGATLLNAVGFYLVLSYMPTYLSTEAHLGSTASFVGTTVSLIIYIFFIFAAGALSDRFGRKTMLIAASVCFMALTVPLFALLDHVSFTGIVLIEVILGAMLTMNDGTLATYLTEVFPTRVRYTGFAFSFNAANALFGGTAPFVATLLISLTGSKLAPAWYLVAAATVTLAAMLASKETAGKPLQ
jgi:MHS family proline/betaine transporter-like MFS transporter